MSVLSIPNDLPGADAEARAALAARASQVLRPTGALRRFDEIAAWLGGWQRTTVPTAERPGVLVFVADHGVAERGVSAYPPSVTAAMLDALRSGVATASVMSRALGGSLEVIDVGVGRPTEDITVTDALDPQRALRCWDSGASAVAELDADLLVVGEMGIGNTTAAAALAHALLGMTAEDWTGRGTGVDDEVLARKTDIVRTAAARVQGRSPLEMLRSVGGAELVAMAGAVIAARQRSLPVVLDGFVVGAAVAALYAADAASLDHCIAGHRSAEPGHRLLLDKLGLDPLLDLELRLGEGSGALAAVPLVRLAAACVTEVATFSERGLER